MTAPVSSLSPPASQAAPIAAFLAACLAIAFFSGMDAVMKGLSLAIGVYNALLWRNIAGGVMAGAIWAARRPRWPDRSVMRIHLIRGVVGATMAWLFFWGLARVPIAQAISLAFIAPLIALFLAAWLLGERISRSAILASLIAFAGVIVIMVGQGQTDMGPEALWGAIAVLGSALCYAWNIVLMRQQAMVADPMEIAFFQTGIVTLIFAAFAPWLAVVPQQPWEWGAVLLGGFLATIAHLFFSWAYARGEASYLAPSEYTAFLWAALFGWMFFNEGLSAWTVAGAALIITGCLWAARSGKAASVANMEAAA